MTEKITASQIKTKLETLIKKKFKYDKEDFFKALKYGSDFDWEKYAKAIASKDKSIFEFEKDDTDSEIQEKSFMQILNQLFTNEDVMTAADIDMDDIISGKELEEYFSTLSTLDGNGDDISLDDISKLIEDKEIDLDKTDAGKEALKAEQAQAAAAGGGGGAASVSGGGQNPTSTTNTTDGAEQQTSSIVDSYPFIDTSTLSGDALKQQTAINEENLKYLFSNTSNELGTFDDTGDNVIPKNDNVLYMQNLPAEYRTQLQELATQKEYYESALGELRAQLTEEGSQKVEALEAYTTSIEQQSDAQEALDNATNQQTYLNTEIESLNSSISTLGEQITGLQGQIQDVPSVTGNTDEERAASSAKRQAVLAQNAQIRKQIQTLNQQKALQEQQLANVQAQNDALTAQITGTLEPALQTATDAVTTAKAAVDALGELTESEAEYMQYVADYQATCTQYNQVKNQAMQEMNAQLKADKARISEEEKTKQYTPADPSTTAQGQEAIDTYNKLQQLQNGEIKVEDLDSADPVVALWKAYNGDEGHEGMKLKQETIETCFGSVDNYFMLLATVQSAQPFEIDGKEVTYTELLLNPENYEGLTRETVQEYQQEYEAAVAAGTDMNFSLDRENIDTEARKIVAQFALNASCSIACPDAYFELYEEYGYQGFLQDVYLNSVLQLDLENFTYVDQDGNVKEIDDVLEEQISDNLEIILGMQYLNLSDDEFEQIMTEQNQDLISRGYSQSSAGTIEQNKVELTPEQRAAKYKDMGINVATYGDESMTLASGVVTDELLEILGINKDDPDVQEQLEAKGIVTYESDGQVYFGESTIKYDDLK